MTFSYTLLGKPGNFKEFLESVDKNGDTFVNITPCAKVSYDASLGKYVVRLFFDLSTIGTSIRDVPLGHFMMKIENTEIYASNALKYASSVLSKYLTTQRLSPTVLDVKIENVSLVADNVDKDPDMYLRKALFS